MGQCMHDIYANMIMATWLLNVDSNIDTCLGGNTNNHKESRRQEIAASVHEHRHGLEDGDDADIGKS